MYYSFVIFRKAWKLFHGLISWQKQVMDQGQNLIDFGEKQASSDNVNTTTTTTNPSAENNYVLATTDTQSESTETNTTTKPGKANKSLFEITRVEPTHGESAGENDSEFDDTFSETHDSSSTSIVESILRHDDVSESNSIDIVDRVDHIKPLTVSVETLPPTCDSTTSSASSTPPVNATATAIVEPPSRFRIVKITKNKPYEKGKWSVSDFQDKDNVKDISQKQTELNSDVVPPSPSIKRTTNTLSNNKSSESSGEQKITENNKNITSPNTTEPVKSKSSELFSVVNSRGSSYNTVIGERRSSQDSTTVTDSSPSSSTPNVTPMVEALESALDQIHSIKESMLQSFTDEMKRLKENIVTLQSENTQLKDENEALKKVKEENESLKKKVAHLEDKLQSIDKG